jgi:large subunit ribosomal protein L17
MRHGDKINNLGRTASHRRAMLANMTNSLIEHKRITTTLAKAKALRRYVEPLITKSKDNTTHSRRVVFSYLQNKEAVTELFSTIATKIADRPGGYLRVIKLGFRRGDGAETAMIEFVDFNDIYNPNASKTKTSKRTRRGGKKATTGTESAVVADDAVEIVDAEVIDTPAEEEVVAAVEAVVETPSDEVVAEATDAVADTTEEKKDEEAA